MSWRTVVITKRSKLDLQMGCLVVRNDEVKRIFLDEVALIICEVTSVSITTALLAECIRRKIKVIFCDEKHSPISELVSCHGSFDSYRKIVEQLSWKRGIKNQVWGEIVKAKIRNQAKIADEFSSSNQAVELEKYVVSVLPGDPTNVEGHVARLYFRLIFGEDFKRFNYDLVNSALNYGYSLLLSTFNRSITSAGYLMQIGIKHCNPYNPFNFSCDLVEPFRALIDREVLTLNRNQEFSADEKHELITVFEKTLVVNNMQQSLLNAIDIFVHSTVHALNNNDPSLIANIEI